MASSSNYSFLISSKNPIRLSPMIHSRRQHPVVLKESGGFLGFSGLKEQKVNGCSIHVLQRNPSFGSIQRRCNKGWRSETGKEKSVEEDDAGINGSTEKETDYDNDWKLGSSMSAEIGNDVAKDNIDGQKIPNETGEDKTSTEYWCRGYVNANRREYYANLKLLNPEFQPPPLDEEWREDTEPFFYNESERRYYYFVKGLATTVKESLKPLMKALMVVPLSFIIVALALKDKVDVVMKTEFHDDKVSSQEQEDSMRNI